MPDTDAVVLSHIQARLADLYDTPVEHPVADYLITDPDTADRLTPPACSRDNHERLLVASGEDALHVALYVDDTILRALVAQDPLDSLHAGNLQAFLIALEGVSHFHYVVSNALRMTEVTPLELELQAEVDKFVTCAALLRHQRAGHMPPALHQILFEGVSWDETLDEAGRERYREANFYAARYCEILQRRYPAGEAQPGFLPELRAFYRLSRNQKIRHIRLLH